MSATLLSVYSNLSPLYGVWVMAKKNLTQVPDGAVYQEDASWSSKPPTPDFTGVVARKQNYEPYSGQRTVFWYIEHYLNGKRHCEDGPAEIWWTSPAGGSWKDPPEGPVRTTYYLSGQGLTKKAWQAAVDAKASGNTTAVVSLKKLYHFTGSFESEEFEYHGYEGTMWCVRVGDQWFVLDAPSRKSGTFTRKINDIKKQCEKHGKPAVVEVSQTELERLMVEQINQVLRG